MKVSELLIEERQKDFKYTEKRVKNALDKVILELEGSDSGAMSRLMTRYQRLDKSAKLLKERRDAVNAQVKDVADRLFDAEDAVATRIIETVSYTVMLTKATRAADKEPTQKIDFESAFSELARLVPQLTEQVDAIRQKYTTLEQPKDTPSALKVTDKKTVKEGLIGTAVSAIKNFVKDLFNWGREYDAKLDAFRRKYKLKAVPLKESKEVKTKALFAPANLSFSELKEWVQAEVNRHSDQEDLRVELVKTLAVSAGADEANGVVRALNHLAKPGVAKAYRMSDRMWCIVVVKSDLNEEKWSGKVDSEWTAPEGLFTKPADHIARKLKAASKDLKQAMSRLNFYINRAGENLSDKDHARLEHAKEILHSLYEGADVISGFKPHEEVPTGYNGVKHWTGGSNVIKHGGKQWHFTGKAGTHNKTKKRSFEFSNKDNDGDHRMWVDIDGNVTERD